MLGSSKYLSFSEHSGYLFWISVGEKKERKEMEMGSSLLGWDWHAGPLRLIPNIQHLMGIQKQKKKKGKEKIEKKGKRGRKKGKERRKERIEKYGKEKEKRKERKGKDRKGKKMKERERDKKGRKKERGKGWAPWAIRGGLLTASYGVEKVTFAPFLWEITLPATA